MQILIILISTVICAAIVWNYKLIKCKGKFTRLDVANDGVVHLEFDYKNRFFGVSMDAKAEIEKNIREDFKGLKDVRVNLTNNKEITIVLIIERVDGDKSITLMLDEQAECLTNVCNNYV